MNEQRLVTLILLVLLVLGTAGIIAFYFTTEGRMKPSSVPATPERTEADTTDKIAKKPSPPSNPVSKDVEVEPAGKSEKETAVASKSELVLPGPSSAKPTGTESNEKAAAKEVPSTLFAGSHDAGAHKDQPVEEPETVPEKSPVITIHETSKSNGSFHTAQEITEGVILGKRGAEEDRSDFYKIRAKKKTMILRLVPDVKKQNQHFVMVVFNANKKPVGKDSRKTGPTLTLEVTPEATYYIKLDLRHAPVEKKSQYRLYVNCE